MSQLHSDIQGVSTELWKGMDEEPEVMLCNSRARGGWSWALVYQTIPVGEGGGSSNQSGRAWSLPKVREKARTHLDPPVVFGAL